MRFVNTKNQCGPFFKEKSNVKVLSHHDTYHNLGLLRLKKKKNYFSRHLDFSNFIFNMSCLLKRRHLT